MKVKIAFVFALVLIVSSSSIVSCQAWFSSTTPWSQDKHDSQHSGTSESICPTTNSSAWKTPNLGYGFPRALIVADGRVFVLKTDGSSFYVLDETTGAPVLARTTFNLTGGLKAGGAYYDGRLIVAGGDWIFSAGSVLCVNATTGNQLWKYVTTPGQVESNPTVFGNKVFFGTTDNYTYCFDIATGTLMWRVRLGGEIWSSPAIDGNVLCIGCDDGKVYAFDISGAQPVSLWNKTIGVGIKGPITIKDGRVYASGSRNGVLYVLDKANGDLIWSWTHRGVNSQSTLDVTVGDGIVFVHCLSYFGDGGVGLYALNASLPNGNYTYASTYLWKDDNAWNSPGLALAGGIVLCPQDGVINARNASTGALIWQIDGLTTVVTSPPIADGHAFVADQNFVFCVGSLFPPVTNTYSLNVGGQTFTVTTRTNSTITNLNTSNITSTKNMTFSVESSQGTGVCNVTLPNSMLGGPYTLAVGGQLPWSSTTMPLNGTHTSVYFTYNGTGKNTVQITGTTAIPEFSGLMIYLVFGAFLLGAVCLKRGIKINRSLERGMRS